MLVFFALQLQYINRYYSSRCLLLSQCYVSACKGTITDNIVDSRLKVEMITTDDMQPRRGDVEIGR